MLMDAPLPREDVRPFLHVARLLPGDGAQQRAGILAADIEAGLLLLEDFGDDTYTRPSPPAPARRNFTRSRSMS